MHLQDDSVTFVKTLHCRRCKINELGKLVAKYKARKFYYDIVNKWKFTKECKFIRANFVNWLGTFYILKNTLIHMKIMEHIDFS